MDSKKPLLQALVVSVLSASVAGAVLLQSASCASAPDPDRVTDVIVPDFDTYVQYVDPYLTRRCGTLDCHGQPGRAYRVYGREGYRLNSIQDGELVSGQQPTQPEEQRANFEALVSLEPEEMSRLMGRQGANPNQLMFLRKPLKIERHKGGPAMSDSDAGYRCVVSWLSIPVVDGQGTPIPKAQRQKLSPTAIGYCTTAADVP
ncbi:MAG: hypothetical protein JWP97_281 [Labilithrix sp.]|nr:hypothetical protein [Labilithrix sp.]